jgi:hypothetical protein
MPANGQATFERAQTMLSGRLKLWKRRLHSLDFRERNCRAAVLTNAQKCGIGEGIGQAEAKAMIATVAAFGFLSKTRSAQSVYC